MKLSCDMCSHTPFRLSHNKKLDNEMASPATNSTAGYKHMFITEPDDDLSASSVMKWLGTQSNMKIVAIYSVRSA